MGEALTNTSINYNGTLLKADSNFLNHGNRGLRYGDALFESLRVVQGKIMFWEDHYLRLMASMRILRMEIPMTFTMEFLAEEIQNTIRTNGWTFTARVRFSVFRNAGGLYLPESNDISYIIETAPLESPFYILDDLPYTLELFKDFYIAADMLSTLKSNNRICNVVGSIFAKENGYDNCLLLNTSKQVVEALNGNVFMINGNDVTTPPLTDGCLNGIIRKKIISILDKSEGYSIREATISPFDLQKADELFITNAIVGIRPVTQYRKKTYPTSIAKNLLGKLNALARLEAI